jgi:hypothetical protein
MEQAPAAVTADNLMRIKRLTTPYHADAIRSYVTRAPFGRFVVSLLSRNKTAQRDSWVVEDRATGAVEKRWTREECLDLIDKTMSPPTGNLAFLERFLVWKMPHDPITGYDCVLYDRVTGRYWKRELDPSIHESIRLMTRLQPHLPGDYHERDRIRFPTVPDEWFHSTSNSGVEGRKEAAKRRKLPAI